MAKCSSRNSLIFLSLPLSPTPSILKACPFLPQNTSPNHHLLLSSGPCCHHLSLKYLAWLPSIPPLPLCPLPASLHAATAGKAHCLTLLLKTLQWVPHALNTSQDSCHWPPRSLPTPAAPSPSTTSLTHCSLTTWVSSLSDEAKPFPASGPLYSLFLPPGMLFPWPFMGPNSSHFSLKYHLHREALSGPPG